MLCCCFVLIFNVLFCLLHRLDHSPQRTGGEEGMLPQTGNLTLRYVCYMHPVVHSVFFLYDSVYYVYNSVYCV